LDRKKLGSRLEEVKNKQYFFRHANLEMIIKKIKIDVEIREVESKNINFIIISI
jgi:hypothetical protein